MTAAKKIKAFSCSVCGGTFLQYEPSCPRCYSDNALIEIRSVKSKIRIGTEAPISGPIITFDDGIDDDDDDDDDDDIDDIDVQTLAEVQGVDFTRFMSGVWSFDKVLDGGPGYGAVVLLGGAKGAGKSTLSTRLVAEHVIASREHKVHVGSAEEPIGRFKARMYRLGYGGKSFERIYPRIGWSEDRNIVTLLSSMKRRGYTMALFDSINRYKHPDVKTRSFLTHGPAIVEEIVNFARDEVCFCLGISRLTKSGETMGSADQDYDVDAVVRLERMKNGRKKTPYVKLFSEKNRLGREDFVGYFRNSDVGLLCVNRLPWKQKRAK